MNKNPEAIFLVEKSVLSSALSIRHSEVMRLANADANAAKPAKISTDMWMNIKSIWGVHIKPERTSALWITKKDENNTNEKWDKLAQDLKSAPVEFEKITKDDAQKLCFDFASLHVNEVFYHEPGTFQLEPSHVRLASYQSIRHARASLFENEWVMGFKKIKVTKSPRSYTLIVSLKLIMLLTRQVRGGPKLFKNLGINIPVGVQPVLTANWLNSLSVERKSIPIIDDRT